ncbi:hypothetical protein FOB82_00565 [Corynebacterium xerosis]|uniref:Uncharacterized protein n=1 Tax=Corynebacterium xerosis TaxID=1725 RepID=A0A6B8TCQ8_9CORY|nr:hypothetical protein [Corynebacterium xerosis]QGS33658.1 hypothetical protein FOB82_00565 [Corynebacterium xerosis]
MNPTMADAPHDPNPLRAWLAAADADLRGRLTALAADSDVEALVAWCGIRMDEVERIDGFLGPLLKTVDVDGARGVADAFPAVLLASLVGRAARVASTTDLWADWTAGLQLDSASADVGAFVEHVVERVPEILGELSLPDVALLDGAAAEPGTREDSSRLMMLHAGVQQSVMPLLIERIEDAAGIGGEAAGAAGASSSDLVQKLQPVRDDVDAMVSGFAADVGSDVPRALRVLAQSAPARARRLVQATLGYVMATAADPSNWESREDLGADDVGLPPILLDAAREELRARPAGTPSRRTAVGVVATTGRPQLFFDELENRVCVQLPTPSTPAGRSWLVTYGGTVVAEPAVALGEATSRPVVPITEPVREVLVELGDGPHWRVPAIDTADPVLIFGDDGQSVTDKVSLHSTSVHVVFPNDARLVDPVTGDDVPLLSEPAPAEWELWQVAQADLRDVHALQVVRPGVVGEVRSASPMRRPKLTVPHARLDGASTTHGTPVHAGGPVAVFPPTLSGRDESWRVQVADFPGYGKFADDMVMVYELEVPAAGGEVDVLTDDDYPWLGEFVVRLTNPRGRSFQAHVAVAEQADLDVSYRGGGDGFRIPDEAGLSPAEVRVTSGDKPLEVEPAVLRLGPAESSGVVELSTEEGAYLELRVEPGRLRFEIPLADENPARRTRTLRTRPGRVDAHGVFKVSAPGELRHAHLAVKSGERDICRVPLTRRGDDAFADLGTYADRVAMLSDLTISLDWTRVTGRRRLSVPLVEAPKTDTVRSVTRDGGELVVAVDPAAAALPLTAWVWRPTEPWRAPIALPVVDGRCALPDDVDELGTLIVQVVFGREHDRRPLWPAPEASVVVGGADDDGTGTGTGADAGDTVEDLPEAPGVRELTGIWSLFETLRAGRATIMPQVAESLAPDNLRRLLTADPRTGLAALNGSAIRLDDQPGMVVSSGLVLGDFTEKTPTPGRRRVPWLGALAAMADLADPSSSIAKQKDQIAHLRRAGGEALIRALATGQDTTLESACIDKTSVQITALPEPQANAILAQVFDGHRMVPGPLTDDDARFTAIHEVVANRAEIVDAGIMPGLAGASRALFQAVSRTSPKLRKAVNVRFHKLDGIDADDPSLHWTLVPGTSLLIAVAARALARQKAANPDVDDSVVRNLIPLWAQLADMVPTLVMGDLLIADALVTHAINGDLTDPQEPEVEAETAETEAAAEDAGAAAAVDQAAEDAKSNAAAVAEVAALDNGGDAGAGKISEDDLPDFISE